MNSGNHDSAGRRTFPVLATYVLLAVNVLLFVLMTLAGGSKNDAVLLNFGASYGPLFRSGQYWRLVMPMFLHIGWAHLATNMAGLLILGWFLEPLYGYGRFTLIYVLSGMAGSLLSMEASSNLAAGASGSIMGIAGAMLVTGLLHPDVVPRRWKPVFGIGILLVIIINLIFGHLVKHIDNWAHLGGLLGGALLAWLIPPVRLPSGERFWPARSFQYSLILPAAVVAVAMGATASHYVRSGEVTALLRSSAQMDAAHHVGRALALAQQARRIEPNDLRVHEALGALYLELRQYTEAIRELHKALRLDPGAPQVILPLALAYEGQGNLKEAKQILQRGERSAPQNTAILQALADVCVKLKQYQEGINHYKRALKLNPDAAFAQNNLAWLYATCEDPRYRNPRGALRHALVAVKLTQWRVPDLVDTLAAAFYINGKFKLAAEVESRAVRLEPNNPTFQANLARYRKAAKF